MGLFALIILHPIITEDQKNDFYEILEKFNWENFNYPNTPWLLQFDPHINRVQAIDIIKDNLEQAKKICNILHISFVVQLSDQPVYFSSL